MKRAVLITIAFLLLFLPKVVLSQTELDFAQSLFDENDYYRAITEAKRYIFLNPESKGVVEARLLIARAYMAAGQLPQAEAAFLPVIAQKDRLDLAASAIIDLGRVLERIDPIGRAVPYYQEMIATEGLPPGYDDELRNQARYRLGWVYIEKGKWTKAQEAFSGVSPGHELSNSTKDLSGRLTEGDDQPYKSPELAGLLSAVLPGAGQVYNERYTDAAIAFTLNAAFIAGTIEAYNSENWMIFALLGLIETAWYGGNIYNAVNGAQIHNSEVRGRFIKKLRRDHGWRLGYDGQQKGFLLSWSMDY